MTDTGIKISHISVHLSEHKDTATTKDRHITITITPPPANKKSKNIRSSHERAA